MKKSTKLWVYPLSIFMLALSVLSFIDSKRFLLLKNESAQTIYEVVYGLIFIGVGIYFLMVMFLDDSNDHAGEVSFKEILSGFAMFAVPSFFLCYLGYLKVHGAMNDYHYNIMSNYDIFSYAQLIFAILCFYLFYVSYPRTKLYNIMLLLSGLMVLASGFMLVLSYTELLFYLSYALYILGILVFGFSWYLADKKS